MKDGHIGDEIETILPRYLGVLAFGYAPHQVNLEFNQQQEGNKEYLLSINDTVETAKPGNLFFGFHGTLTYI